jgi:hypothetical protein
MPALLTASLSFFLFSFQVHEKSVLLPLMPVSIMMCFRGSGGAGGVKVREGGETSGRVKEGDGIWDVAVLINNVSVFR